MTSTSHDPGKLSLHHHNKDMLPEPDTNCIEWYSFVEGLRRAGPDGIPAIIIAEGSNCIIKGRRRWLAAKQLGWERVNCVERPEEHCAAIMIEALVGHRDMSRGAKVYFALGLLKEFVEASEHRRLANLKRGAKIPEKPLKVPKSNDSTAADIDELCLRFGVGRDVYFAAVAVRKALDANATLKEEWEPKLLSGESSLWNIRSALGGATALQVLRDSQKAARQLDLFGDIAGRCWQNWTETERVKVIKSAERAVDVMPIELLEKFVMFSKQRLSRADNRSKPRSPLND